MQSICKSFASACHPPFYAGQSAFHLPLIRRLRFLTVLRREFLPKMVAGITGFDFTHVGDAAYATRHR